MTEIVVFGGTTEGRTLCELLGKKRIKTLICVATEYGETLLPPFETVRVHTGRLDQAAMKNLLEAGKPRLVIDATHPYAAVVSENIRTACEKIGVKHIRIFREKLDSDGCVTFTGLDELISWLNERQGTVFSTLGAKEAAALAAVGGYRERLWLRILPDAAGLSACLAAGFPAQRIICMQGPFSRELNAAMFRAAGADILLTKETGITGGYPEKIEAARACGMITAVLSRPREETGLTLAELVKMIEEDAL
ncbi:MAG: precorrin-6A reductase [Clostridia bacterium]|nr:precorrin-6A reductase [Clostridia bacterium]